MTDQGGGLAVLMQVCRTGEAWPRACLERACPRGLAGWQLEGIMVGRLRLTGISLAAMSEAHTA